MSRLRSLVAVGFLVVGATLVALGSSYEVGYVDPVASAARATAERRFDNRDLDRAQRSPFASRALVAYDRGVRASAAGELALAVRQFQEVIARSDSPTLRAKAYYNLGNLLALAGKAPEAASMYREALRLDPSDWDAKANLEMLSAQADTSERAAANATLRQAPEPGGPGGGNGPGGAGTERVGI